MTALSLRASLFGSTCALALLAAAGSASAQSCGDADGNGNVDVIDAANVLRAAVDLGSACATATARCDVDASGVIDVIDAANVLRTAVDLPANLNCEDGGGNAAEVEAAVKDVTPFLTTAFTLIPQLAGFAAPAEVDDCPDGGTRDTIMPTPFFIRVALDTCRFSDPGLGDFQFDGTISVALQIGEVAVDVDVRDLDTQRVVQFDGVIPGITPLQGGGFVADGGPLTLTTSDGNYTLTFDNLTVDGEGHVVSGKGTIEDADDNFELDQIDFTVTSATTADILATFDDQSTSTFLLNLVTGDLTPVG
jgi:hypothetical protein